MIDQSSPAALDALHARLAAQEARIVQLERRRRLPRRLLPVALAALLVALVPLATLAANPFTDLTPGSVHNGNIDLIYNAGITTGCDPTSYCPNENVTRQEMASFLARTAGLGSNPPIVNAKTAQTATNATNAQNAVIAQTATNATNAQNAVTAQTAANATNAQNATTATNATNAQNAVTAQTATTATSATSANSANTVGGYLPGDLVRVGFAQQGSPATVNGTPQNNLAQLATVRINTPGPGYVVVIGSVSADQSGVDAFAGVLRVRHVNGGGQLSNEQRIYVGNGTFPPPYTSTSVNAVYTLPGGPTAHDFILEVAYSFGGGAAIIKSGEIDAIFIPFGTTGVTP